ncbi:MAG: methyltransferase domain-containing protein [Lachnospiraceae bacterium]
MKVENYYTTGQFAKKANVSIRTIRYYDSQNLLKPSQMTEAGYRLYTDNDFARLQKILTLKYLGFSLDEISGMLLDDEENSIRQSLEMQLKLVRQKIEHWKMIEQSIEHASRSFDSMHTVDWEEMLHLIHLANMEHSLVEQYKNSTNIDARIQLHRDYATNSESWFAWLYRQIDLRPKESILEVGCGNGELWLVNWEKVPDNCQICLSDVSAGMVKDAKEHLKNILQMRQLQFQTFDCHEIPLEDESVDCIIANHVMFYLHDRKKALREIVRVLKPEGRLICSTYSAQHMKEINELVAEFDSRIVLSDVKLYELFGLENGASQLQDYFSNVQKRYYRDKLVVNQEQPLLNYILSCHGNQHEYLNGRYSEFKHFLKEKLDRKGVIEITKEAGCFICYKNF